MLDLLCRQLRRNPNYLWHIDRNTSLVRHFFSTEALDSTSEDRGKGIHSSRSNNNNNLRSSSSSSSVAGAQYGSGKASEVTPKTLLRRYGFKDTHLSKLHTLRPDIFTCVHPQKTLLPKLEFFRGIGISNTDLPKIACSNERLLGCSLENQIVPWYNYIKKLLVLSPDDDEGVVKIMKRCPRLITTSIEKTISPNVAALREAGVPHSRILHLLRTYPSAFGYSSLRQCIEAVTEMGFDPNKTSFVDALKVFVGMSKSTRDKKMEVYRKCGMTDEEILKAFGLFPICMALSEENIVQTMDFVVNNMGWLPVDVARFPPLLCYSLEKRTIPRCTVVRYLQGKGFLRKNYSCNSFLSMKEKDFIGKFVKKYEDDVPGLMDIYLAKISPPPPPPQEQILQSETAGLVGKR